VPAGVTAADGSPCVVGPVGATECHFNAKRQTTNYAPTITATAGASYKIPTSMGNFIVDGSVQYIDKQYEGPDNLYPIAAHTLINASLTWQSPDTKYSVRLWSKNLFDTHYLNDVLEEAVGILEVPGDPRTFGVTVSGKF
jgi:iron complex outermembrane receptor protein